MEKMQFIYQLQLIPSLMDEGNWTDKENAIVQRHFEVLQNLQKEGKLHISGENFKYGPHSLWDCYFRSKFRGRSNRINEQ